MSTSEMTPDPPPPQPTPVTAEPVAAPLPIVTYVTITLCALVFVGFNVTEGRAAQLLSDALVPSAERIWHGALWGLVTSAFVHVAFWHILFNMVWTRDFGRVLEPEMQALPYLGFVLGACVVSSGWQLLVSDSTGIGFSGVVYAMFGYAVARRASHPMYAALVTARVIAWMLGWLLLCVLLTRAGVWNVANAAHVSGLAAGYLTGLFLERTRWHWVAAGGCVVLAVGVVLSCTYMPWSEQWNGRAWLKWFESQRRLAEAGDAHSQAHYGSTLMQWPEQREAGLAWLRRSAESGNVEGMNGLAWWLAVAREDRLRDGKKAVTFAKRAYEADPAPQHADTLAAAYAEAGRWDEAIAMQERAIADAAAGPGHVQVSAEQAAAQSEEMAAAFADRLARYKRHESWRE